MYLQDTPDYRHDDIRGGIVAAAYVPTGTLVLVEYYRDQPVTWGGDDHELTLCFLVALVDDDGSVLQEERYEDRGSRGNKRLARQDYARELTAAYTP